MVGFFSSLCQELLSLLSHALKSENDIIINNNRIITEIFGFVKTAQCRMDTGLFFCFLVLFSLKY